MSHPGLPHQEPDDPRRAVPMAVFWLAALVVVVVAGIVLLRPWPGDAVSVQVDGATPPPPVLQIEPEGEPLAQVRFAAGSSVLPADAHDRLEPVVQAADAEPEALVLLSAFGDAAEAEPIGERLAHSRALAVRHALEASGVSWRRVAISPPRPAAAGQPAAPRVELRLLPP